MQSFDLFGTHVTTSDFIAPEPDNNNWRLMEEWMTPAEFMQWLRRKRESIRRDFEADFSLRNDPDYQNYCAALDGMEKCCLWHHYGVREG